MIACQFLADSDCHVLRANAKSPMMCSLARAADVQPASGAAGRANAGLYPASSLLDFAQKYANATDFDAECH